jgi:hypothetical protein
MTFSRLSNKLASQDDPAPHFLLCAHVLIKSIIRNSMNILDFPSGSSIFCDVPSDSDTVIITKSACDMVKCRVRGVPVDYMESAPLNEKKRMLGITSLVFMTQCSFSYSRNVSIRV